MNCNDGVKIQPNIKVEGRLLESFEIFFEIIWEIVKFGCFRKGGRPGGLLSRDG